MKKTLLLISLLTIALLSPRFGAAQEISEEVDICPPGSLEESVLTPTEAAGILGGSWDYFRPPGYGSCEKLFLTGTGGGLISFQQILPKEFDEIRVAHEQKGKKIAIPKVGDAAFFSYRIETGFGKEATGGLATLYLKKGSKAIQMTCQKSSSDTSKPKGVVCSQEEYLQIAKKIAPRLTQE
ncbi:MAG: hypothetical protein HYT76_09510 [Deltaproteobacteria bacterium]|nr:hypothetical protein [Deltaproteobacteria bacterium]